MLDALPINVDLFAGGGGASTGFEEAFGCSPDIAINHSETALALHAANHPDTLHINANIWDVRPVEVANGRKIGVLWASPDCKHFSRAAGGTPKDRDIRDLAWNLLKWMELPNDQRPDVVLMENVMEFTTWGPICEQKRQPIKELAGITYEEWVKRIKQAGYKIQRRERRGCDYGDATIRKRSFWIMRCDGRKIIWPKPTHGDPNSQAVKRGKLKPWPTAADCIDWTLPCPSIFLTKEEAKAYGKTHNCAAPKRPLAGATMARAARGLKRYVLDAERPFIVNLPSDTPDAAETTTAPSLLSLKGKERRDFAINTPHPTILAGGGHSAILTPVLTYAQQGGQVRDPRAPMHTICASHKDQNAAFVPLLLKTGYGERKGQKPRALNPHAPLGTIVAGGTKHAPAAAFLAQHNGARTGVNPGRPAQAPISTITGAASQQNLVASYFAKYYGTGTGAATDEPCHTITANDRFAHFQSGLTHAPQFSPEHERTARMVADLMRQHGYWDDREFVTLEIDGETFVIVDVGMRMLTPRELFNAQGFPSDYVIEGVWSLDTKTDDWKFKAFPKKAQTSCVGNSVCPGVAREIIAANCQHLIEQRKAA